MWCLLMLLAVRLVDIPCACAVPVGSWDLTGSGFHKHLVMKVRNGEGTVIPAAKFSATTLGIFFDVAGEFYMDENEILDGSSVLLVSENSTVPLSVPLQFADFSSKKTFDIEGPAFFASGNTVRLLVHLTDVPAAVEHFFISEIVISLPVHHRYDVHIDHDVPVMQFSQCFGAQLRVATPFGSGDITVDSKHFSPCATIPLADPRELQTVYWGTALLVVAGCSVIMWVLR